MCYYCYIQYQYRYELCVTYSLLLKLQGYSNVLMMFKQNKIQYCGEKKKSQMCDVNMQEQQLYVSQVDCNYMFRK